MNEEQFEALGRHDPVAQHEWCIARDKELRRLWNCPCDQPLPTKGGYVWMARWTGFKQDHRLGNDPTSSGYYCDNCAAARKMGKDW